jgi:hypothetical protein
MNRRRMLALPLGLLLVGSVVLATSATSTGCSSAQTKPAPDAALSDCNHGPFYFFCEPTPAAGQPGCSTAAGTSPVLSKLPKDTTYPIGCVVNFVGSRDEQGDCRLDEVCKCVAGEVAGAPATEAGAPPVVGEAGVPAGDAGDSGDAGDDAEAGAPAPSPSPQQPPAPTAVWLCSP